MLALCSAQMFGSTQVLSKQANVAIVMCSDWSIRWLKEEEMMMMNCHLLITSCRTNEGRENRLYTKGVFVKKRFLICGFMHPIIV